MPPNSPAQIQCEDIWDWLSEVPDPEIPVISVVDLGIVRDVKWEGDRLNIDITPTYSGCPATGVIRLDIETALVKKGIENLQINTVLSPAWTTEWISETGRENLRAYGIVPPVSGVNCAADLKQHQGAVIQCPRCGSAETREVSRFGSTPCKASYQCGSCLEPFDYFKSF